MKEIETNNLSVSIQNGTLPGVPFLAIKEKVLGKKYDLSIVFVSPKKAQAINIERRGKDYIPNTLSFSLTKTSGEIILCMNALKKQHAMFDMELTTYIIFILIHSMLHLKGMTHGGTMETAEKKLLAFFTKHEITTSNRH